MRSFFLVILHSDQRFFGWMTQIRYKITYQGDGRTRMSESSGLIFHTHEKYLRYSVLLSIFSIFSVLLGIFSTYQSKWVKIPGIISEGDQGHIYQNTYIYLHQVAKYTLYLRSTLQHYPVNRAGSNRREQGTPTRQYISERYLSGKFMTGQAYFCQF